MITVRPGPRTYDFQRTKTAENRYRKGIVMKQRRRTRGFWILSILVTLLLALLASEMASFVASGMAGRFRDGPTRQQKRSRLTGMASRDRARDVNSNVTEPSSHKIAGKVRAKDGKPIEGASVCASCVKCNLAFFDSTPQCVRTGRDGNYVLSDLEPGEYRVSFVAKGYTPKAAAGGKVLSLDGKNSVALSDLDGDLEEGGVPISGTVSDVTGGPVVGAIVRASFETERVTDGDFVTQSTLSDEGGQFQLWGHPGPVRLVAVAEGYAPVELFRTAPANGVELIVTPSSTIQGRVVSADEGVPVANVHVVAKASIGIAQRGASDSAGRFEIRGLRPETYRLRASGAGWLGEYSATITLDLGDTAYDVEVPVHRAVTVRGTLFVDNERRPCTWGHVSLGPSSPEVSLPSLFADTDSSGAVVFDAVPPGRYAVNLSCNGYGVQTAPVLDVGDEGIAGVVWKMASLLSIDGRVTDEGGGAVARVHVQITPDFDPNEIGGRPPNELQAMRTDETGAFAFHGLRGGTYTIRVQHLDKPITVELSEDESPLHLPVVVNPVGHIEVVVRSPQGEPVEGLVVAADNVDGSPGMAAERSNIGTPGKYHLGPLPAGPYHVHVGDGINPRIRAGGPSGSVEVLAGKATQVEVEFGGYSGRITGRVIAGPDLPLENVWVQALPADYEADRWDDMKQLEVLLEGRRSLTGLNGEFQLSGLAETGTFVVVAERPLGGRTMVKNVRPGSEVEILMPSTGKLEGVTVGANGQPVQHFSLHVFNQETGQQLNQIVNDPDGRWTLGNITPGPLEVTATDARGNVGTLTRSLSPDQRLKGLRLELDAPQA